MRSKTSLWAGTLLFAAGAAAAIPAPPAGATTWNTWQEMAISALNSAGYGPVTAPGASTPVTSSTVTTGSGQSITIDERSFDATVDGDTVVVSDTVLQGTQLLVAESDPVTGVQVTLVLQPGASSVREVRQERGRTARSDIQAGPGMHADTPGSCDAAVWAPVVVGSAFGPLIGSTTGTWCGANETLAVISALYEWTGSGSRQVTASGASVYGESNYVTTWAACTPAAGDTDFQTAGLWSVNGALQPGLTSAWTPLACAPF